jgi:putative effector of murein hydrolase LrgA (UPF0299 family)
MQTKPVVINIVTNPKMDLMRSVMQLLFITAIIGIGVVLDSRAMEWIGFIIVMIAGIGIVVNAVNKDSNLTIAEARLRLDDLEKKEL